MSPTGSPRAFRREGLLTRIAPFAVPYLAGVAITAATAPVARPSLMILCGILTVALTLAVVLVPWERMGRRVDLIPPVAAIGIVVLISEAAGEPARANAPLMLLPLFWLALHGTRSELMIGYSLTAGSLAASQMAHGGFHGGQLRFTVLALITAPVVCFTAQNLVSQVRAQSETLASLAHTDVLTGVPNRRGWDLELEREMARSARESAVLCIAVLDLDHFKEFNDRLGHQAGDELLRKAARDWSRELRASDVIARYGGEEFAVLLPNCKLLEALEIIERVRSNTPGDVSASAGVAGWDGEESADVLFARADASLYQAKLTGRNKTVPVPTTVRQANQAEREALATEG